MENTQTENQEVETVETEVETPEVEKHEETIEERLERINTEQDELQQKQKEFFDEQKKYQFEKNGLSAFEEVIKVGNYEELNATIAKLTKIVNDIKVANSYQPTDNAKQDAYSVHTKNKDTKNMIGTKLSNLFK